jgi:hypothetical protein
VLYAVCIQTSASIQVILWDLVRVERMVSVVSAEYCLSLCNVCVFFCRHVCQTSACLTDSSTLHLGFHGPLKVNFAFVNLPVNRDCRIIQLRGGKNSLFCTARLFINLGPRWGWVVDAAPRPLYPRKRPGTHCIGGWVGPRAGLDGCGKSYPYGIRSSDRPARCESLYRLSYPGANITNLISGKLSYPVTAFPRICRIKRVLLCYENPSSRSRVVLCGRTDMTTVIVAFRHFANAPKNWLHTYIHTHTHTHTHTMDLLVS